MKNQIDTQKKNKIVYNKENVVKMIAEECDKKIVDVHTVHDAFESVIARLLSSATPDSDITVKLFEGITIDSVFVPEETKINNLTGNTMTYASKIKPKANITRSYQNKLNNK